MKVFAHYCDPPKPELVAALRARLYPEVTLSLSTETSVPSDTTFLINGWPKREELLACPFLEAIIIPWAGVPTTTRQLMSEFPHIRVHNLHYNAAPVAELALGLLLAVAKLIVPFDRSLRAHDWSPRYQDQPVILLQGKTALILGYGAIGHHVAALCRQLGMMVLATRRQPDQFSDGVADEIHPPEALPLLLPRSDVLIICLPLTPETEDLIAEDELKLLHPNAMVINVGRGPIINQAALYQALRTGRLQGAGLDVWYHYPREESERNQTPPADFPFHELDNVVMSPHRAGFAPETDLLGMEQLAALLNDVASGRTPNNLVDLKLGY